VTDKTEESSTGHENQPAAGALESSPDTPATAKRRGSAAAALGQLVRRLRQPLPGAQPRLRFEIPPEYNHTEEPAATEDGGTGGTAAQFGRPGPRMSMQHPLYMGFMGTVGVGLALLVYWIGCSLH